MTSSANQASVPQDILQFVENALNRNGDVRLEYTVRRDWVVVPVESASHFTQEDCRQLAQAMPDSVKFIYPVPIEDLNDPPDLTRIGCGVDDFMEFDSRCTHFQYALIPDTLSFLIVCTTDDYYLVVGTKEFVEAAVGASLESAIEKFREFVDDEIWSGKKRMELLSIVKKYAAD